MLQCPLQLGRHLCHRGTRLTGHNCTFIKKGNGFNSHGIKQRQCYFANYEQFLTQYDIVEGHVFKRLLPPFSMDTVGAPNTVCCNDRQHPPDHIRDIFATDGAQIFRLQNKDNLLDTSFTLPSKSKEQSSTLQLLTSFLW